MISHGRRVLRVGRTPPNLTVRLHVQPHLPMPRFLLVMLALVLAVYWSLALFGPPHGREAFLGGAQGATLATVVITALAEIGVWVRRRPRS